MTTKAIIYDLDNTLYPVAAIGHTLFAPLFELLQMRYPHPQQLPAIQQDIMRKPFQVVAAHYTFGEELTGAGLGLLRHLTYNEPIASFPDYAAILALPAARYLVTTGFTALQHSKIRALGIGQDFVEIHVVDPMHSAATKKDVFADIMARHGYAPAEVLVVGDDPESELKAAQLLTIPAVLYCPSGPPPKHSAAHTITSFHELAPLLA